MHRPFLFLGIATAGALAPMVARDRIQEGQHYCYTQWEDNAAIDNAPYDGRFTFFRVRFEPSFGGGGGRGASAGAVSTRSGITTRRAPNGT